MWRSDARSAGDDAWSGDQSWTVLDEDGIRSSRPSAF